MYILVSAFFYPSFSLWDSTIYCLNIYVQFFALCDQITCNFHIILLMSIWMVSTLRYYNQWCCKYCYIILAGAHVPEFLYVMSKSIFNSLKMPNIFIVTVPRILCNSPRLHSWCVNLSNLNQSSTIVVLSHCGHDKHFPNKIEYAFQCLIATFPPKVTI